MVMNEIVVVVAGMGKWCKRSAFVVLDVVSQTQPCFDPACSALTGWGDYWAAA